MPRYVYYFAQKELSFFAENQEAATKKMEELAKVSVAGDENGTVVSEEFGDLLRSEVMYGGQKE